MTPVQLDLDTKTGVSPLSEGLQPGLRLLLIPCSRSYSHHISNTSGGCLPHLIQENGSGRSLTAVASSPCPPDQAIRHVCVTAAMNSKSGHNGGAVRLQ